METPQPAPSDKRWIAVLWLILSQLGSILLLLGPFLLAFTVTALMMAGGAMFILYVCAFPIIPIALIVLSWIFFARRKDKAAAITSGVLLLISIAAFVAFNLLTPSIQ